MKIKKRKTNSKTNTNTIVSSKPFRRARTKIKKPKFLSLSATKLQKTHPSNNILQPDSYPGHPNDDDDNNNEEDEDPPEMSMADHMFAEAPEGPTTLAGLLAGAVSSSPSTATTTASGVSYAGGGGGYDSEARLVRTAMRGEQREESGGGAEEKWVSISEVVERRCFTGAAAEEEVTSGGGGGGLWLKLDYEEVLNAWSGKGGPFCGGGVGVGVGVVENDHEEMPQTVPDLDQYGVVCGSPFWGVRNEGHWSVPENSFNVQNDGNYSQAGGSIGEEPWKMGIREASVLRYKEKRRNRLFAKRIRYEVRKLNAEKRPRIKGRFVRRCGD